MELHDKMTDNELNKITCKFSDVKPLIDQINLVLIELNRLRKRLKTKRSKYKFINDLIDINSAGNTLVNACVDLFKELGIGTVENIDKKYYEEDIRIWHGDKLIIVEVTGIDTPNPKFTKAHQISLHIRLRQEQYKEKEIFGLFIVNHDNKKYYKQRNNKPFNNKIIDIAKSHKYTLMTTTDLLNAYKMIKMEKLKPEEFIEKLCLLGLFKI